MEYVRRVLVATAFAMGGSWAAQADAQERQDRLPGAEALAETLRARAMQGEPFGPVVFALTQAFDAAGPDTVEALADTLMAVLRDAALEAEGPLGIPEQVRAGLDALEAAVRWGHQRGQPYEARSAADRLVQFALELAETRPHAAGHALCRLSLVVDRADGVRRVTEVARMESPLAFRAVQCLHWQLFGPEGVTALRGLYEGREVTHPAARDLLNDTARERGWN